MADGSTIEWTEATWNPVTGCTKVNAGCKHCYAERMSLRLQATGKPRYSGGFTLALHEDALTIPFRWRSPRLIFVNSMSDLFQSRAISVKEAQFDSSFGYASNGSGSTSAISSRDSGPVGRE